VHLQTTQLMPLTEAVTISKLHFCITFKTENAKIEIFFLLAERGVAKCNKKERKHIQKDVQHIQ
jgi:hypothetical protein